MSLFEPFTSVPGALRKESLDITLKFDRISPSTGRIQWNIPTPSVGCSADTQAYCGMLLVVDQSPAAYEKTPEDGIYYEADPTVDRNLHAGDTLDTALVVGAFYEDRTTIFADITGLLPNTPYYVSGYPVDCQGRYHQEGVHAYSLNYETGHKTDDKPATQTIQLLTQAQPNTPTGLIDGAMYTVGVSINSDTPTQLIINGHDAQTYQQLIDAINRQFAIVGTQIQSNVAPNTGQYYWAASNQTLYQWNGNQHVAVASFVQVTDPTIVTVGTLWYQQSVNILKRWNGTNWVSISYLNYQFDVTSLGEGHYWFNGTTGHYWNGTTWCELPTYISSTDPSLPPTLPHGTYWYNTSTDVLYVWDVKYSIWRETTAIVWNVNPYVRVDGMYWFNDSTNLLYRWSSTSSAWETQINVHITETAPTVPAPLTFWYNPTDQILKQWNDSTLVWDNINFIQWHTDPTIAGSCVLWWNTTTDQLLSWDSVHSQWDVVVSFIQSAVNPALPPALGVNDIWYNTTTGEVRRWENRWASTNYIVSATDPTVLLIDDIWFDGTVWRVWTGVSWATTSVVVSELDPFALVPGALWFNTSTNVLSVWTGTSWSPMLVSTVPLEPADNTLWFNTLTNTQMRWDGTKWVVSQPIAHAELVTDPSTSSSIVLTTALLGSTASIGVDPMASPNVQGTLWRALDPNGMPPQFQGPVLGTDGNSGIPSYLEIGAGTDGSPDQRQKLTDEILMILGAPTITVELTKTQLDQCINMALDRLRARSASAYKHGYIFLQVKAAEQHYMLTNKTKGFNKIVMVSAAHRLTSSFLSTAHGAGVYGQIVMQHLYSMGTFDLLSYHIMSDYVETMEILFAARLTFYWDEQTRRLSFYHRFTRDEVVALEVSIERTEQDIISDRWTKNWIQRYAAAHARLMLSEIRGKYAQINGPGVGVSFNASDLAQRAMDEFEKLEQELEDFTANAIEDYGISSSLVVG